MAASTSRSNPRVRRQDSNVGAARLGYSWRFPEARPDLAWTDGHHSRNEPVDSMISEAIVVTGNSISEYVALAHSSADAAWLAPPRSGRRRICARSGLAERLEKRFEREVPATAFCNSAPARREAACRPRSHGGVISPCALSPSSARWRAKGPAGGAELAAPTASDLAALIDEAPPMQGGEYLRPEMSGLRSGASHGARPGDRTRREQALPPGFLESRDSRWRLVGRVHFNLAENRRDPDYPFAFMATYTSGLVGAMAPCATCRSARRCANTPAPATRAKLLQLLDARADRRARPAPG